MGLAVCLFIVAGITVLGTLTVIGTTKQAGTAIMVTLINAFAVTVEIMAAFRLMHGG